MPTSTLQRQHLSAFHASQLRKCQHPLRSPPSHLSIMTMQSKCKSRAELAKLAWVIMPRCSFAYPKLAPIHLHALIWFVIHPLWFVNTAFCTSKHPTTVKNTCQIITFLPKLLHNSNKSRTFAPREPAKPLNDAQMCGSFFYTYDKQDNIQ